jgi:Tfp pilus assembly protein PilN
MRPVNLIPKEEQHGSSAPLRGGPLAYIIVGALLGLFLGVLLLVTTSNEVSEKKAESTELSAQIATAEAEASRLASYATFAEIHEQRLATVSNLANSRFDWEKVLRQLALVLPSDIWVSSLTGTVNPEVEGGGGNGLRSSVAGPALEMSGCAGGQEAVADFITSLRDIDGVTRVGVQSSSIGGAGSESGSSESESAVSASGACSKKTLAQFQLVVAFDAAPIPEVPNGESIEVEAPPTETTEEGESSTAAASSE